ncbi:uncharacterized protein LOC131254232 [Magnolia sinica]|uniref:uncharacterized protein LOC131254232 n=1 Tax=Magnolia sinica TaxID=86752 RepID=UPI00265A53CB|nr:uncharacterized protein LOC131254232 [Magnolia sinica]
MAKKRKSDASRLDEVDRTMYTTFCSAANSLSQLYTQAMNQQKLAFQAGERHGMEKLYQWILRQHEEGSRVSGADLVAYIQNELDYGGEDTSMSPRLQSQHQHSQPPTQSTNSTIQASSGSFGQAIAGQGPLSWQSDQTKNSVFSNALSSPIRHSLQPFHLAQGGYYPNNVLPAGNGSVRNQEINAPHQTRDSNFLNSNDASMDMHAESPTHESY